MPICQASNSFFEKEKRAGDGPETGRRRAGDGPETGRRRAGDGSRSGDMLRYRAVPSRIQPYPSRYRSSYITSRHGSDPIRSDTGACTPSSGIDPNPLRSDTGAYTSSPGMDPILSDPIPKLIPLLPEWIRPDPMRHRSLYILYRDASDLIRSGTGAYTLLFSVEPILSDTLPELLHPLPQQLSSYPTRCRSLYIPFRNGSDPIQKI
jgi:hypothetical protein